MNLFEHPGSGGAGRAGSELRKALAPLIAMSSRATYKEVRRGPIVAHAVPHGTVTGASEAPNESREFQAISRGSRLGDPVQATGKFLGDRADRRADHPTQGADTPVPVPVPVPDLSGDGDGASVPVPDLSGIGDQAAVLEYPKGTRRGFCPERADNSQTRSWSTLSRHRDTHLSYLAIDSAFDEEKARNDAFTGRQFELEPSWERWLKLL